MYLGNGDALILPDDVFLRPSRHLVRRYSKLYGVTNGMQCGAAQPACVGTRERRSLSRLWSANFTLVASLRQLKWLFCECVQDCSPRWLRFGPRGNTPLALRCQQTISRVSKELYAERDT
jgi:hypothetical protein